MNYIRHVFPMLAFTASMLLGVSIAVTPATASIITYSFNGPVTSVQNKLNPPFFVDTTNTTAMFGSMTVNGDVDHDSNANHRFGVYTITAFNVNIEGKDYGLGSDNLVVIRNGLPGQDRFIVSVSSPTGPNVVPPTGPVLHPNLFEIILHAPGGPGGIGTAFNSDALPASMPPSINSVFNLKNQWRLVFEPGGKQLKGFISSVTASVVPLPAAVILFGAGLVALVGLGAGSWRKMKNSLA